MYMRKFGPLRLYWEGGFKGEGLLRYVKPLVRQGVHKKTFPKTLFTKFYRDKLLQQMLKLDLTEEINDNEDDETEETGKRYTRFRVYKNLEQIEKTLEEGNALSIFISEDNEIYCMYYGDKTNESNCCIVEPLDNQGEIIMNTHIAPVTLKKNEENRKTTEKF